MIPIGNGDDRSTEEAAARFQRLDTWSTGGVLEALWAGQIRAVASCLPALPALARAVAAAGERRAAPSTGRLVYAGAGSSGMIAALDAGDLGPTFNWPEHRTLVIVAGGIDLERGPDPAAEDDAAAGRARVAEAGVSPSDVVLGVSASGGSAHIVAVVEDARRRGAMTVAVVHGGEPGLGGGGGAMAVAVANRAGSALGRAADHAVVVPTGAEVIAGSTRLAAGTSQKL